MKVLKVTCAILLKNHKILACQNSEFATHAMKWEFPGGKIEIGETEIDCIKREIFEELNLHIEVVRKLQSITFDYLTFRLELIPFEAEIVGGEVKLNNHIAAQWISLKDLNDLDWAITDRLLIDKNYPFFETYLQ